MHFNRVVIIGVGLIGGSFALAIRKAGLASQISGWNSDQSLDAALSGGLIDEIETSFEDGRRCNADLIYLSAPVSGIIRFLQRHGRQIEAGTFVTDAGSTKRHICAAARECLPMGVQFVGGHPMAGSHHAGIDFADAGLFSGAPYALVADPGKEIEAMRSLVEEIGGRPIILDAAEHDEIAARISHAPQLLSTALAVAVAQSDKSERVLQLAGSGFASMTRLAESPWSIWEDICRLNRDEIAAALDLVLARVKELRNDVESGELDRVSQYFDIARRFCQARSDVG